MSEYDYVIVGAGSAGCVLANRLSDDASILVLEAGEPDEKREIGIPIAWTELFRSSVDWEYSTVPQKHLDDREMYLPQGKTLGGSSSINALIHVRGHPDDYDHWESLGNEGWGYDDLLPYFRRSESDHRDVDPDHHGTDGPLSVTENDPLHEMAAAFIESGQDAGLAYNPDFNGERLAGVGPFPVTVRDGKRHSAADAYLKPVLDRPTIDVRTGARVTRVRFDGDRAVGVEYVGDGTPTTVDAGDVILSAGAIKSPHLLMHSGVGPADHLREYGVDVVHDLPGVGRNLQDHLTYNVNYSVTRPVSLTQADTLWNLLKYLVLTRGPFTSNVAEAGAFVSTDGEGPPDVELLFGPGYFMNHGFDSPDGHGFTVGVIPLRPESRGRIALQSDDPLDPPTIDPQYLDEPADRETIVEGVRRAREIARTDAFAEYRGEEVWPGADRESDEAILDHVSENVQSLYHPVGTCKMGDDGMAVVDDRLRVHGVENLRVVDASVMPTITRANTNAPTIAIAERAADLIREE